MPSTLPHTATARDLSERFDKWYREQKEMNPYIMRDWFIDQYLLRDSEIRRQALEEAEKIVSTHAEGENLGYCDTGSDIDNACRSKCVEMAVKRLASARDISTTT